VSFSTKLLIRIICLDEEDRRKSFLPAQYLEAFQKSIDKPDEFWAQVGKSVKWFTPWTKVIDNEDEPFTKWFAECINVLSFKYNLNKNFK
jgi:hypothetical protein